MSDTVQFHPLHAVIVIVIAIVAYSLGQGDGRKQVWHDAFLHGYAVPASSVTDQPTIGYIWVDPALLSNTPPTLHNND